MTFVYGGDGMWRREDNLRELFLLPLGESQGLTKVVRLGGRHLICRVISLDQEVLYKKN